MIDNRPTPPPLPPLPPLPPRPPQPPVSSGRPAPTSHRPVYSFWWPLLAGVLTGLALRLAFMGAPGKNFSAMMWAFILLSPMVVGMITVYTAERIAPRRGSYYVLAPIIANSLYIAGSLFTLLEGVICAIIAWPLFVVMGVIGGLLMGLACRITGVSRPTVYSIAALPLVFGAFGGGPPPERIESVERRILIRAPAETVWHHLLDADRIRHEEVDRGWIYRIGVPTPMAGVTHPTATGLVRDVTMGRGIRFQQMSTDWQPHRYVRWRYHFTPESVPPRALDDHVRIGGDYFDLRETVYRLTPKGDATELSIRMDYRVSTDFNWYAVPLADLLIGNFSEVILDFYRQRSENDRTAVRA